MAFSLSTFEKQVDFLSSTIPTPAESAKIIKKSGLSIRNCLKRIKKKKGNILQEGAKKQGRKKTIKPRTQRQLKRHITGNAKTTNQELLKENSVEVLKRTIQRFLKEEGYSRNVAKKVLIISEKASKERLRFAKENKNITTLRLERIIF